MKEGLIFYIYGLCTMFYGMMAWLFAFHGRDRLWRLVTVLMAVLCAGCIKDIFFMENESYGEHWEWVVVTALDMVAVPLYAFVLRELCEPGTLTWRRGVVGELPFVVLPVLLIVTHNELFYDIEVAWAAAYGFFYAVWTFVAIPRFHRHLRETFSYTENINLNWLRTILLVFIGLIVLWTFNSLFVSFPLESAYMISSMVAWMFICYFLYRHESVISELQELPKEEPAADASEIGIRIEHLMMVRKAYLNPRLKLSDVAAQIHSNRTYVSNWFNRQQGATFFDYVNRLRIEEACSLLRTTRAPLDSIAHDSGFNSLSAFYRIFAKLKGVTPTEFRDNSQRVD